MKVCNALILTMKHRIDILIRRLCRYCTEIFKKTYLDVLDQQAVECVIFKNSMIITVEYNFGLDD